LLVKRKCSAVRPTRGSFVNNSQVQRFVFARNSRGRMSVAITAMRFACLWELLEQRDVLSIMLSIIARQNGLLVEKILLIRKSCSLAEK